MCGIAGFWGFEDKGLLRRMARTIKHRGPDDDGFFESPSISLLNVRLSIIDLQTGKQPIFNEDKSVVVVYNGEIYNYAELTEELKELGHVFRTKTDTEVIVHAYEQWGADALLRFNGMFAFALYDTVKKQLLLARDRLGIKPLYYHSTGGRVIFASEIKAILADRTVPRKANREAVIDFITYQNILDEKTFFEGIEKVMPGQYLMVSGAGVEKHDYWRPRFTPKQQTWDACLGSFRTIFRDATERHLISDVPTGVYLSGGFDSTSVATMASTLSEENLRTFTGYFEDGPRYSELPAATAVAEKIGAEQHRLSIGWEDYLRDIKNIVYHLDEPTTGSGAFPQFQVARLVSKHVKVVLTGHGGDELFAGYHPYKVAYLKDRWRNPLRSIRVLASIKPSEMPRLAYYAVFPFFDKEVSNGIFIMFNEKERRSLFDPAFLADYDPRNSVEKVVGDQRLSALERVQLLYMRTYLPTLFILEDKVSMAHSVESRTPLCDNEIVDFSLRTTADNKLHAGEMKAIVRNAMRKELPSILYHQPKRGFPTPFALWFRGPLKQFAYDILTGERIGRRGIFNVAYLKKMLDDFCSHKGEGLYDYAVANRIYSLITVELWFRTFIDGEFPYGDPAQ